jgi:hypothetical protein
MAIIIGPNIAPNKVNMLFISFPPPINQSELFKQFKEADNTKTSLLVNLVIYCFLRLGYKAYPHFRVN